jgi:hypothetical protein
VKDPTRAGRGERELGRFMQIFQGKLQYLFKTHPALSYMQKGDKYFYGQLKSQTQIIL